MMINYLQLRYYPNILLKISLMENSMQIDIVKNGLQMLQDLSIQRFIKVLYSTFLTKAPL